MGGVSSLPLRLLFLAKWLLKVWAFSLGLCIILSLSMSGGILAFLPVFVSLFSRVNFFLDEISGLSKVLLRLLKYFCLVLRAVYSKSFFASLYLSNRVFAFCSSLLTLIPLLIWSIAFE